MPLVNCAYANLQRQLYRKALKNAENAIAVDNTCLKAYLLGSKILLKLKKKKKAIKMIQNGLNIAKELDDTLIYFDTIIEMEDAYETMTLKKASTSTINNSDKNQKKSVNNIRCANDVDTSGMQGMGGGGGGGMDMAAMQQMMAGMGGGGGMPGMGGLGGGGGGGGMDMAAMQKMMAQMGGGGGGAGAGLGGGLGKMGGNDDEPDSDDDDEDVDDLDDMPELE